MDRTALPTAIVPVRSGPGAKRRLAHVMRPAARRELIEELFGGVVDILLGAGLRTIAVSPAALANPHGAEVWFDAGRGLNATLDHATDVLGAPVLIVHADLPFFGRDDVEALLDSPGDVVIARARDGGTNALLMRERIPCAFGPSSALAHAARARRHGYRAYVLDRPTLALDIDDETSLNASVSSRRTSWPSTVPRPAL